MNKQFILNKIIIVLLFGSPLFSFAHLSSKTAQVIVGQKPDLGIQPEEQFVFSIDGGATYYSDIAGDIPASFSPQLTFAQFSTKSVLSSLSHAYIDQDGDEAALTDSIIADTDFPVISWQDATGKIIPTSDYNKEIGACDTNYRHPLKLILTANNVTAKSEFGIPIENNIGKVEKEYSIFAGNLCYLQPYGMQDNLTAQWWGWNGSRFMPNQGVATENGGGYTADFNPLYGFVAKPSVSSQTFPTKAMPGAQFQLIMNSAQSDYTYTAFENGALSVNITVDNSGNVTLKNKTTNEITIQARPNIPNAAAIEYKFNVDSWFSIASTFVFYSQALLLCDGEEHIPTRIELSNSPYAFKALPEGPSIPNLGSRAIGNLSSEWAGNMAPNINLDNVYHVWTNEVSPSASTKYTVYLENGQIKEDYYIDPRSEQRQTICKL